MLQVPAPTEGALPAKTAAFPHTIWSGPALETDGFPTNAITTSSIVEATQGEFETVHFKV